MSEFCKACSLEHFGTDYRELAGRSTPEDTVKGMYPVVLCEGCGPIQVDHNGICASNDCLCKGQPEHGAVSILKMGRNINIDKTLFIVDKECRGYTRITGPHGKEYNLHDVVNLSSDEIEDVLAEVWQDAQADLKGGKDVQG